MISIPSAFPLTPSDTISVVRKALTSTIKLLDSLTLIHSPLVVHHRLVSFDMPPKNPKKPKTSTSSGGPSTIQTVDRSNEPAEGAEANIPSPAEGVETEISASEDYNKRIPERTELLTRLRCLLEHADVSPAFWACCQLADMERLESLVRVAKENDDLVPIHDELATGMIKRCQSPDFQRLLRLHLTVNMLTLYRVSTIPKFFSVNARSIERVKTQSGFRLGAAFRHTKTACSFTLSDLEDSC
jgi:hypothetical protein